MNNNNNNNNNGRFKRIYELNENYFDNVDLNNQEQMYILGLLFSDGNNYSKRNTITISLQEEDGYILEKIKNILSSNVSLSNVKSKTNNRKNQKALRLYSSKLSKKLFNLGCIDRKANIFVWPSWLPLEKIDAVKHFLRGYFDGDGSIVNIDAKTRKIWRWQITSNLNFCNSIAILLHNLNIPYYLSKKKNFTYDIRVQSIYKALDLLNWLYEDATIYLDRKYLRYLKLKNYIANKQNKPLNIIKQFKDGISVINLSKLYNLDISSIYKILRKNGIYKGKKGLVYA